MSHHHGGFVEGPIPGLPGPLPEGETLLWQGSPDWKRLALTAMHVRLVAAWFAVLLIWSLASGGGTTGLVGTLVAAGFSIGILAFLAWAMARATIYTITSKRVVMRYGVALEKCINIPFRVVKSAGLRRYADGTGDLPLQLALQKGDRLGWAMLWPHARPWKLARPEPMLRAVPDAETVASILSRALLAAHPDGERLPVRADPPRVPEPAPEAAAA